MNEELEKKFKYPLSPYDKIRNLIFMIRYQKIFKELRENTDYKILKKYQKWFSKHYYTTNFKDKKYLNDDSFNLHSNTQGVPNWLVMSNVVSSFNGVAEEPITGLKYHLAKLSKEDKKIKECMILMLLSSPAFFQFESIFIYNPAYVFKDYKRNIAEFEVEFIFNYIKEHELDWDLFTNEFSKMPIDMEDYINSANQYKKMGTIEPNQNFKKKCLL